MFEHIREDFRAHGSSWGAQGFWAMAVYRYGRWAYSIRSRWGRKPFTLAYQVLFKWIQVVAGIELPCHVPVGKGFVIDHSGGIVVSGYAKFGDRCRIRTGVVIGLARVDDPCAPEFGNDVDVGAGAKVLGRIRIGNGVRIGANAVVLQDVPDHCVAAGVPAIVKLRRLNDGG